MSINVFELFVVSTILYTIYSNNNGGIRTLLKIIMFGGYILDFVVLVFYGWNSFFELLNQNVRMETDLLNANILGITTSLSILINLYFILIMKEIKIYDLLIIFGIIILAFSASRKAIVMAVIGTIVIIIFGFRMRMHKKTLFPYLFVVSAIIALIFVISNLSIFNLANDRIDSLFNFFSENKGNVDGSTLARMKLNEIGVDLFNSKPLFGYGIDNAKIYGNAYFHTTEYYLHNNFLEILANLGLVGFVIYYLPYIIILYRLVRYWNSKSNYFIISFVLFVLTIIIDYGSVSYSSKQTIFLLLVMWFSTEKLKSEKLNFCYNSSLLY